MKRILVIEDNLPNRELLCDWLEMEGFLAVATENLTDAFAALENELPDLVLLDVQLGHEDGLAVAETMRKDPRRSAIPVIAVTAHAMVTDQERVIQAGCNACVSKPIDFPVLRQQLDWWLTCSAEHLNMGSATVKDTSRKS